MFYIVSPWELNLDGTDPKPDYDTKYALPMFFVLIFLEWAILEITRVLNPNAPKTGSYRLNDFIMSVALGACQATFQLLLTLVGLNLEIGMYTMVYENYRITTVDTKSNVIFTYVCLFLGKDLMYYAAHRFFHEYHTAWIGHSVHHSGEDYNLGTALRQGALQPCFGWPFYLPMAFLGFHPHAFAAHAQLNTYFMFWIHTELVGRLGVLEYIINTPSAHRMHHRPPGNCNYAGALIIWDRMFDTFRPEKVRMDLYGNGRQPNSFDVISVNAHRTLRRRRHLLFTRATKSHTHTHTDVHQIMDIPKSIFYRLFARRVKKPRQVRISGLFEKIPAIEKDRRLEGPRRKKWDGEKKLGVFATLWFLVFGLAGLLGAIFLLIKGEGSMHRLDAATGALASCIVFSALGRFADRVNMMSYVNTLICVSLQYAVLMYRPFEKHGDRFGDLFVKNDGKPFVWGSIVVLLALGGVSATKIQARQKKAA